MEKKVGFLVNVAYYGIICAIVILFFKYGMKYVLPFASSTEMHLAVMST